MFSGRKQETEFAPAAYGRVFAAHPLISSPIRRSLVAWGGKAWQAIPKRARLWAAVEVAVVPDVRHWLRILVVGAGVGGISVTGIAAGRT
jgi:hypothetical protein